MKLCFLHFIDKLSFFWKSSPFVGSPQKAYFYNMGYFFAAKIELKTLRIMLISCG